PAPPAALHGGALRRAPDALLERRAVVRLGAPVVRLPRPVDRRGHRARTPRARLLSARPESLPRVARLAPGLGDGAHGRDRDDPLPPEAALDGPRRAEAAQGA